MARRHRLRQRASPRPPPDRDDAPRDRPGLRGQGGPDRHSRPGHPRPEDPAPEVRDRARGEERRARARARGPAARGGGAGRADGGLCRPPAALRRGHVPPGRPGAQGRPARAARGRAGDAARPRPRDLSVRHLVEPDRRRGDDRRRHRADPHRPRPRGRQGLRHARGRGAVPHRDRGPRSGARARARRRVRDDDGPRAPLRLAGPRRAPLRRPRQRDDRPRAHQDRRPLAFAEIPVCVRYRLPDGTETEDFPAHQSDFHHAAPVYETLAGWRSRSTRPSRSPTSPPPRAPTSPSSRSASASRSASSRSAPSGSAWSPRTASSSVAG